MEFTIIKEFPQYEISKEGVVRSVETKHIKSQRVNANGYYVVSMYDRVTKKTKTKKIHRLVAEIYLPRVEGKPNINHIDGSRLNNDLSNLEWCTQKENIQHAFRTGLVNNTGANNGMSLLSDEKVLEIKKLLKQGVYQRVIGEKFGVSRGAILKINLGKAWNHVKIEDE